MSIGFTCQTWNRSSLHVFSLSFKSAVLPSSTTGASVGDLDLHLSVVGHEVHPGCFCSSSSSPSAARLFQATSFLFVVESQPCAVVLRSWLAPNSRVKSIMCHPEVECDSYSGYTSPDTTHSEVCEPAPQTQRNLTRPRTLQLTFSRC